MIPKNIEAIKKTIVLVKRLIISEERRKRFGCEKSIEITLDGIPTQTEVFCEGCTKEEVLSNLTDVWKSKLDKLKLRDSIK